MRGAGCGGRSTGGAGCGGCSTGGAGCGGCSTGGAGCGGRSTGGAGCGGRSTGGAGGVGGVTRAGGGGGATGPGGAGAARAGAGMLGTPTRGGGCTAGIGGMTGVVGGASGGSANANAVPPVKADNEITAAEASTTPTLRPRLAQSAVLTAVHSPHRQVGKPAPTPAPATRPPPAATTRLYSLSRIGARIPQVGRRCSGGRSWEHRRVRRWVPRGDKLCRSYEKPRLTSSPH